MQRSRTLFASALLIIACVAMAPAAKALPALQLYIPEAVYDVTLETWIITEDDFELWVIGDVGSKGTIYNVDLAASVYGTSGSVSITPSDPLVPLPSLDLTPELDRPGYEGLVNHQEYANADDHIFWTIGDFTETDDVIQDYQPGTDPSTGSGEIKKYMVHVSGYEAVHFDAFNHYFTGRGVHQSPNYVTAPYSHDATGEGGSGGTGGGGGSIPEPSALVLMGSGLIGLLASRLKK